MTEYAKNTKQISEYRKTTPNPPAKYEDLDDYIFRDENTKTISER